MGLAKEVLKILLRVLLILGVSMGVVVRVGMSRRPPNVIPFHTPQLKTTTGARTVRL